MADFSHIADRFWSKVRKGTGAECWEWTMHTRSNGYGHFWISGKSYIAHRLAWVLANGPVPAGMYVLHRCDNPACVRPSHLYLGTAQSNALDREARGRGRDSRGSANGKDKLTGADVLAIRAAHADGTKQANLSRQYGVHKTAINKIVKRLTWRHI